MIRCRALMATLVVTVLSASVVCAQEFQLVVAETPAYWPWNGLAAEQYRIAGDFGTATRMAGIAAGIVDDPCGLAFRSSLELFVGDRARDSGNGSVPRFQFDSSLENLIPSGGVTGNEMTDVHQVAFNPVDGELFAANWSTGIISRFVFDVAGNPVPNGVISTGAGSSTQGVAVRAADQQLFVGCEYSGVQRYRRESDGSYTYVSSFSAGRVHFLKFRGDELYACGTTSGAIYRFRFTASGDPVYVGSVALAVPIDVAFSPDGREMFAADHFNGGITRFRYEAGTDTWTRYDVIGPTPQLGGIATTAAMASVEGHVDLESYQGGPGITGDIEFRTPGTRDTLYTCPITLDAGGNYVVATVPVGTYDLACKFPNWLRQVVPGVAITVSGASADFSLTNGDAWNDNLVDLLDLSTVLANFGASGTPPIDGDVTWDGKVDLLDLSTILANFGARGDP